MRKFQVVENKFHGSGHVHYCNSLVTGYKWIARHESKGCSGGNCQCSGMTISRTDGEEIDYQERVNAYDGIF